MASTGFCVASNLLNVKWSNTLFLLFYTIFFYSWWIEGSGLTQIIMEERSEMDIALCHSVTFRNLMKNPPIHYSLCTSPYLQQISASHSFWIIKTLICCFPEDIRSSLLVHWYLIQLISMWRHWILLFCDWEPRQLMARWWRLDRSGNSTGIECLVELRWCWRYTDGLGCRGGRTVGSSGYSEERN